MANRYAVASGNWSNTATWDGGTLPGPGDVVRANNFYVNIDQDITVSELRNDASAPAVDGGRFTVTTIPSTITATANIIANSNSGPVVVASATSGTLNIVGSLNGISTNWNRRSLDITGSGMTINVTGNVTVTGTAGPAISIQARVTLSITGIISSSTSTLFEFIGSAANSVFTLNGNLVGTTSGIGIFTNVSNVTTTINGDVVTSGGYGIEFQGSGTITVNGNINAGSSGNCSGIRSISGANVIVNGDVTGGGAGASNAFGVDLGSSGGNLTINGSAYAGGFSAVRTSSAATVVYISGDVVASTASPAINVAGMDNTIGGQLIHASNHRAPVLGGGFKVTTSGNHAYVVRDNAVVANIITLTNYPDGVPVASDVRAGTLFGPGDSNVGTLAVPAPSSVAAGVATDNTVGTAVLTADTLWNHEVSTGVAAKDRLLATSTVDSTGAQIAAATDAP